MFEELADNLRQKVQRLSSESLRNQTPTAWFEQLYAESQGDAAQIPWAKLKPHPILQDWFTQKQLPCQGQALVIGCGLGDDAEHLAQLGYTVTAFDIAPTAIEWCKKRFPQSSVRYEVADLLEGPKLWQQHFDLVYDCRNIQALPLTIRAKVINAIAHFVAPGGTLLLITRYLTDEQLPDGPPWPLSELELALFLDHGFEECDRTTYVEHAPATVTQLRISYRYVRA